MKTKQLITILACIISLCSSTLVSANTDGSKKNWNPIRKINNALFTIPEDGFYLIVVVDATTGEILEDASGYYPADAAIPIPPASNEEVLLVQPISYPSNDHINNQWTE